MSTPNDKVQQAFQQRLIECLKTEESFAKKWGEIAAFSKKRIETIKLQEDLPLPFDQKKKVEATEINALAFYNRLSDVAAKVIAASTIAQTEFNKIQKLTLSNTSEVKALQNCFNAIANSVVPDFKEAVLLYSQFMDSRFIGRIPKEQFEKINGFFKNFLKHENENDTIQSFASSVIQRFPRYVLFAQDFARDVPFLQPGCTLDIQPLRDSTKAINEMIRRDETKVLAEHMQNIFRQYHPDNPEKKALVGTIMSILHLIINPPQTEKEYIAAVQLISQNQFAKKLYENLKFKPETSYLLELSSEYKKLNYSLSGGRATFTAYVPKFFTSILPESLTSDNSTPVIKAIDDLLEPFRKTVPVASAKPSVSEPAVPAAKPPVSPSVNAVAGAVAKLEADAERPSPPPPPKRK